MGRMLTHGRSGPLSEGLLGALPGYKGSDVYTGDAVEDKGFYSVAPNLPRSLCHSRHGSPTSERKQKRRHTVGRPLG